MAKTRRMTVTVELAREWLATRVPPPYSSPGDGRKIRRRNPHHVARLADVMRKGEFVGLANPIMFATDGLLADGQHRLAAIVESGIPLDTLIVEGIDATFVI